MSRPDVLIWESQHGNPEVLARRLPGFATDRREFPDTAMARAYAEVLARRLGLSVVDRLAPAAIDRSADRAGGVQ